MRREIWMRSSVLTSSLLQCEKALARLEVGIVLGDRHQLRDAVAERLLARRLRVRRTVLGHRLGAQRRDGVEHLAFVGGVTLHRAHEVRDQVVAALELGVDVAPRLAHHVAQVHEPVEDRERDADEHDHHDNDDHDHLVSLSVYLFGKVEYTIAGMCEWKVSSQVPRFSQAAGASLHVGDQHPRPDDLDVVETGEGIAVVGREQPLHHLAVEQGEGELLVFAVHVKAAVEVVVLELHVVVVEVVDEPGQRRSRARSAAAGTRPGS